MAGSAGERRARAVGWPRVRAGERTGGGGHRDGRPPAGARLLIAGERGKGVSLGCQPVRRVPGELAPRNREDVRTRVTRGTAGGR